MSVNHAWLEASAEPRWGHAAGLQIGLAPLPGPRGLIRIYAPYLGHARDRLVNFVAIEPIPAGASVRGYSELEHSSLDGVAGKRFWSTGEAIETVDGVPHLVVPVLSERFDNGAHVYVRATFRLDRPYEVALAAYAHDDSVTLDRLVLTATMGNYARLRRLHLRDRTVTPAELWPDFSGDGFTAHARFALGSLARDERGAAVVTATPDEENPTAASYAADTHEHWKYTGRRAVQGWRVEQPVPDLEAYVNGRATYWASTSPIPGGVAFENFEIVQPFAQGQEYVFSVEPLPP